MELGSRLIAGVYYEQEPSRPTEKAYPAGLMQGGYQTLSYAMNRNEILGATSKDTCCKETTDQLS